MMLTYSNVEGLLVAIDHIRKLHSLELRLGTSSSEIDWHFDVERLSVTIIITTTTFLVLLLISEEISSTSYFHTELKDMALAFRDDNVVVHACCYSPERGLHVRASWVQRRPQLRRCELILILLVFDTDRLFLSKVPEGAVCVNAQIMFSSS